MLQLKNICKSYTTGDFTQVALNDVSISFRDNEFVAILGPSGSGKTTLLSIIAGFGRYSNGKLRILGEEYTADNLRALRRKVGFVSSSFFDKYYTCEKARDIILSGLGGGLGLEKPPDARELLKVKNLVKIADIAYQSEQPFNELSKGERQKVLIARALIGEPEILILDEPGTGLDIKARAQMLSYVRQIAQTKMTIIYVTHYLDEIPADFTKTVFLKDGRIAAQGETKELFSGG